MTALEEFVTYDGKCFTCKKGIVGLGVWCKSRKVLVNSTDSCEEFEKE